MVRNILRIAFFGFWIILVINGDVLFAVDSSVQRYTLKEGSLKPFAIVELFTSEGCSSCPSADQLLIDLTHQAKKKNQRIFPLSFHIDYWNGLGWVDPFSLPKFTHRQRQYAKSAGTYEVYTPQMYVNGTNSFIGSDRSKAHRFINESLKQPAQTAIHLKWAQEEGGVEYYLDFVAYEFV